MAKLIRYFLGTEIKQNELEIYNGEYITNNFKYKQSDIVYKVKGKEVYYLIEHQTNVNYSMAYRVLNYCVEIIRSVVENKEINRKNFEYPKVIPIVLYTGEKRWTASTSYELGKIDGEYSN